MGYKLSSCPTFSYFSYFLGLFLLFPYFTQKTLTSPTFFFCNKMPKLLFLSGKSRDARECTMYPTAS